ncbi:MAG TPA: HEAT repeat domain-containing protein [Gammaproteobacteria bacterium]|nr:HEAT repeat domain-containing protein [Gammaproteobacteria bacterium]
MALGDILIELGNELGLMILADGALEERVTVELHDLAIVDIVARLLRNHSYLLSHRHPATGTVASSPNRLRVFARQSGTVTRALNVPRASAVSRKDPPEDVVALVDAVSETYRNDPAAQVSELAAVLSGSTDAELREEAVYALGRIGTRSSLDALTGALADPAERVREAAVYTISEAGTSQARPLLEIALADASPVVREAAHDALELPR